MTKPLLPTQDVVEDLKQQLQEANDTLDAIRNGEVDAVVVGGPLGQLVYTLENADRPYRVLVEQMVEGAVTISADGLLLYANQSFSDLVQRPFEAIVGTSVVNYVDDAVRLQAMLQGSGGSAEMRLRSGSGQSVPINVSIVELTVEAGSPPMFCGIVTDLSQNYVRTRELAEAHSKLADRTRELETSEERLRTVFDSSYQFQALLDPEGILLDANSISLSAIQASLRDVIGLPYWDTPWFSATPGINEEIKAAVAAARAGDPVRRELKVNLPEGGLRSLDFSVRAIRKANGTLLALVTEAVDLTDMRHTEEALRQSQKMEAVGQLTGGLAHDFNNLLAGISGSLEITQARVRQGRVNDVDRYINAAQGAVKRAAALTHRLLAFSRRQTLAPKPTDVNQLVTGMQDIIQRAIGPSISFEFVGVSGLWLTLVDPSQLENSLLNLCLNARDAMPVGGKITVETANKWLDARAARQHDLPEGQFLSLCVSDSGVGMPKDVIARAFEPFFTTKPTGEGTGLGLSMVYGFARQSGGQVRIYSEVGQGTTVCIYLPRHYGEPALNEEPAAAAHMSPSAHSETVLVVDDEPTVRMLITEILEELGYVAIEAGDSVAGLKLLQSDTRIDLLVSDVGLPGGMNGRQMADAARVTRPDLKVLFITGYAENSVLGNGRLAPGMAVMTKPFPMDAMAARIKQMIES
jgi:PAS domain S-box-containing protein